MENKLKNLIGHEIRIQGKIGTTRIKPVQRIIKDIVFDEESFMLLTDEFLIDRKLKLSKFDIEIIDDSIKLIKNKVELNLIVTF